HLRRWVGCPRRQGLRGRGGRTRRVLRQAHHPRQRGPARARGQRGLRTHGGGACIHPVTVRDRRSRIGVPLPAGRPIRTAESPPAAVVLGASSGRVITGRIVDGELRTEQAIRFPNGPVALRGRDRRTLYWDVLSLYSGAVSGLRRAAEEHGGLASVGIDSWAVDYGLLDNDGNLLGNPVHYRDARTDGVSEQVFSYLPAEELYQVNGLQVQPFNTLFQLVAATGDAQMAAADALLLIPDLLGYWLTGERVAELTNASTTGMVDVHSRRWAHTCL